MMKLIQKIFIITLALCLPLLQQTVWGDELQDHYDRIEQGRQWEQQVQDSYNANEAYYSNHNDQSTPIIWGPSLGERIFGTGKTPVDFLKRWLENIFSSRESSKTEKEERLAEYKKLVKKSNKLYEEITQLRSEAKWQAVAFSDKKRNYVFRNAATENQAITMAQNDCTSADCKIITSFTNVCVATIWGMKTDGSNFDYVAQGKTENDAKENGVRACKASGSNQCQPSGTACSGSAYKDLEDAYSQFMKMRSTFHLDEKYLHSQ